MSYLAVVTTVGSHADAQTLAQALVQRGLVACAQISVIESYYPWGGEVRHEPEWRLLLKTRVSRFDDVATALREMHPYQLPALHAVKLDHVDAAYGAWIDEHVRAGDSLC